MFLALYDPNFSCCHKSYEFDLDTHGYSCIVSLGIEENITTALHELLMIQKTIHTEVAKFHMTTCTGLALGVMERKLMSKAMMQCHYPTPYMLNA